MKRVFLIHGWEGKPDNHWFPWLSLELKARGFKVDALTMPRADHPKVSEWLAEIKNAVGRPDKRTFFVGHSLGCAAILRYIEGLPRAAKIGGCVFVAGFSSGLDIPEIEEFTSSPLNMGKIKSHGGKFVVIFSDNDEDVSMERSFEFAKTLGAKSILERGKGHFTEGDGVTALPSAFTSILEMSYKA